MRNLIPLAAAGLLATAIWAPRDAGATTFREMTEAERIDLAEFIVRGEIVEVWTEQDERGRVWTRAQVEVDAVLKGDPGLDALVVDQLGGEWAGSRTSVAGAARFSAGEEVVLMLDEIGGGRLVPLGMLNGKYTVRLDPYTGEEIVQRFAPPQHEAYDHRFIPLPAEGRRVYLRDFEQRIRDRVAPAPAEVK